ncbi:GNAT family N-acetyltransferase [Vibrio methylphosphonaticus]|uniref:GNAT family N-acetyltransferase n=1 Tax=Vibrio methylphosphonaticus TaxID=2946866 RepID=UPI00202A98D8|nr:GNAT family N-acetyltransferase [Vibrio methylphosphonaticus]MCL9774200.1 GNAT family N-acetyltransferase [Vibrio methylphosphonaticus]
MIKIRQYVEADTRAMWEIHFHTIRNINIRDYTQAQVEAWAPEHFDLAIWKQRMNALSPFVAELDGVIVGYTDLQENGLIDHFFCHHDYQGQGVGKALINHVLAIGEEKGIQRFFSEVSITAKPFYQHFGFEVVNAQDVEIRGQILRNFVMEKYR